MIFVSLLLFRFVLFVDGNHFLGCTITWQPLNAFATGIPIVIVVTQIYSWTYSIIPCTNAMIIGNEFVPSYVALSADKFNCTVNCGGKSPGQLNVDVISRCTDFSEAVEATLGQLSETVYLQVGDDFSVAYQKLIWRLLKNASLAT